MKALVKAILDVVDGEPALLVGLVLALLGVLVAFGVPVSTDQQAKIIALVGAALALAGAILVRSQVTPISKLPTDSKPAV